jgi:hypothetical protein
MAAPVIRASEPIPAKEKAAPRRKRPRPHNLRPQCHAARKSASSSTSTPDYYQLVARVESDPDARALAVYNGRERLGSILEIAGGRFAFGALDELLGSYRNRASAADAVSAAYQKRGRA